MTTSTIYYLKLVNVMIPPQSYNTFILSANPVNNMAIPQSYNTSNQPPHLYYLNPNHRESNPHPNEFQLGVWFMLRTPKPLSNKNRQRGFNTTLKLNLATNLTCALIAASCPQRDKSKSLTFSSLITLTTDIIPSIIIDSCPNLTVYSPTLGYDVPS